jgi:hypothetical protein
MATKTDLIRVRKMYERIDNFETFDNAVTRFGLDDLEYLIQDADSPKLTYVYDNSSGPWGKERRQWAGSDIIARVARKAIEAGYTPETLEEAARICASIDAGLSRDGWVDELVRTPATIEYLRDCSAAALDGHCCGRD